MTREEALNKAINIVAYFEAHFAKSKEAREEAANIIEALEQEPKIGQWEWVQYDGNPEIGNFHCSECRYIPAIFNMSAQKLNYCPSCGAKMQ